MHIYKSPFEPANPLPTGNVVEPFFKSPNTEGKDNEQAFIDFPSMRALTFAQLRDARGRFAAVLKNKYDIKKDDVVFVSTLNTGYLQPVHLGAISLGAVISPANILYQPSEIAHQIRMVKPKLAIVADFNIANVQQGMKEADHSCTIVPLSEVMDLIDTLSKDPNAESADIVPVNPKTQHAYYCFSSGTSGLPKGVITSQMNIYSDIVHTLDCRSSLMDTATHAAVLPMSHIYGLNCFLWLLPYAGKRTIVFDKFDFGTLIKGIIQCQINTLYAVPPMVVVLAKRPEVEPYVAHIKKSLKYINSGAAPLSAECVNVLHERFPEIQCYQGYGMTETTSAAHIGTDNGPAPYDFGSVGWLIAGSEMRLISPENGKDVEPGKDGEVWVRGPNIMIGYLNNEKATNETMEGEWLKTGDVGHVANGGQLYVVDRIKELIKSKGHQVAPAELEGILLQHPDVIDCMVLGVPDEYGSTEYPRAYAVLKDSADPREVVKWFNKQIAIHKRLWGGLVKVAEIPKTASGKLLRRDFRGRKDPVVYGVELAKL